MALPVRNQNETFLVNHTPQETRVVLLQYGAVQELHIERARNRGNVGNIYLGRIVRILPGMQAAFVDIGLERTAYLHVSNVRGATQESGQWPAIERLLQEGQTLVVQVQKDMIGSKGARVTMHTAITGRYLVYTPYEKNIGISLRIEDELQRETLKLRLTELMREESLGGIIARTMAEEANDDALAADIDYLRRTWGEITRRMQARPAPALLYVEPHLAQRVLRDLATQSTVRILVDSHMTFEKMKSFAEDYMVNLANRVELYSGNRPLFDCFNIEDEIAKVLARRVELKSGGYLVIDQTEAMTTIDINTGAFVGSVNFEQTAFATNLEAAQTIARQIRLRNLGGMIIVDFIDLKSTEHQTLVLEELRRALAADRTRVAVGGFSHTGLVEITRKRTRESLAGQLCETCPVCSGRGRIKTAQTVCYQILRDLLREARQFVNAHELRLMAAPTVINMFLEEESQSLDMLSQFIDKPIRLYAEPLYAQEHYEIALN